MAARTAVTVTTIPGGITRQATVTSATVDSANGNYVPNDGRTFVEVDNTDSSGHTVTVTSVPDPNTARTADITALNHAAGVKKVYGPFPPALYNQTSGTYAGAVLFDFSASTGMKITAWTAAG